MIPDIDIRIIQLLGEDGRISNAEIARRLGVSEPTVRLRIKQLLDSGKIKITAKVNVEAFPDIFYALVAITMGQDQNGCMELFSKIPNVIAVTNVAGRYDFFAMIVAKSRPALLDTVTSLLQVKSVTKTEAFVVLKNCGLWMEGDAFADLVLPKCNGIPAVPGE